MPQRPLWNVKFLKAEDGSDPFPLFISRLTPPAQVEWEALIRLLQKRGNELRTDRVFVHDNGLREFRGDEVRIFFKCVPTNHEIIVVGGLLPGQGGKFFEAI